MHSVLNVLAAIILHCAWQNDKCLVEESGMDLTKPETQQIALDDKLHLPIA
jgi:hypothetical protein